MPDVKDLIKNKGHFWLTADTVKEGDVIEILGEGEIDRETFKPKSYVVLPVTFKRENWWVRLGTRNVKRISKVFGTDTSKWAGKYLRAAAIEDYPRVKASGIIWSPMIEEKHMKVKEPKTTEPTCPNCKATVLPEGQFCSHCGYKLKRGAVPHFER